MGLNSKVKLILNNVSKEDIYDKLISMGDAGDFSSGKYNTLTNHITKKKQITVQTDHNELLKFFK